MCYQQYALSTDACSAVVVAGHAPRSVEKCADRQAEQSAKAPTAFAALHGAAGAVERF